LLDPGPRRAGASGRDITDQQGAVAQDVYYEVGVHPERCSPSWGHSRLDPDPKVCILTASAAHITGRVPRAVLRDLPRAEGERALLLALGT